MIGSSPSRFSRRLMVVVGPALHITYPAIVFFKYQPYFGSEMDRNFSIPIDRYIVMDLIV